MLSISDACMHSTFELSELGEWLHAVHVLHASYYGFVDIHDCTFTCMHMRHVLYHACVCEISVTIDISRP